MVWRRCFTTFAARVMPLGCMSRLLEMLLHVMSCPLSSREADLSGTNFHRLCKDQASLAQV